MMRSFDERNIIIHVIIVHDQLCSYQYSINYAHINNCIVGITSLEVNQYGPWYAHIQRSIVTY